MLDRQRREDMMMIRSRGNRDRWVSESDMIDFKDTITAYVRLQELMRVDPDNFTLLIEASELADEICDMIFTDQDDYTSRVRKSVFIRSHIDEAAEHGTPNLWLRVWRGILRRTA